MSNLRGNVHDLITDQGSTVHQVFGIKNSARQQLVLTGYVARMQIREWNTEKRDPASTIIADYTTENGYLTVNEASGSVTLLIPPADMASYSPKSYVYDLEVESPTGETTRIIQGKFLVRAEVTK
jgi:hypothetical protein|tara:strand:+ start:15192 stop:15566 length:375 start_codon:yes stop_codon:yes gene_type:complete